MTLVSKCPASEKITMLSNEYLRLKTIVDACLGNLADSVRSIWKIPCEYNMLRFEPRFFKECFA